MSKCKIYWLFYGWDRFEIKRTYHGHGWIVCLFNWRKNTRSLLEWYTTSITFCQFYKNQVLKKNYKNISKNFFYIFKIFLSFNFGNGSIILDSDLKSCSSSPSPSFSSPCLYDASADYQMHKVVNVELLSFFDATD